MDEVKDYQSELDRFLASEEAVELLSKELAKHMYQTLSSYSVARLALTWTRGVM